MMKYLAIPKTLFLSISLGSVLGFVALTAVFALTSATHPGWLRAWFDPTAQVVEVEEPLLLPNQPITPEARRPLPTLSPLVAAPDASCGGPEQMVIALLGIDDRTGDYATPTRTDAIMLVRVDFQKHTVSLFSIPRDVYVALPNLGAAGITEGRINTAYVYGEVYGVPGGGATELKETITLNFGIRVDRYLLVNFGAFVSTVDALGGIDVDVPKAIYDPTFPADEGSGYITLDIPAGVNHFDGAQALRYARTRHQDDDYHRVQRQQQVLLAVYDKLLRAENLPSLPGLLTNLQTSVRTDLSATELAVLSCLTPQIDRATIKALSIDGTKVIPWRTPTGGSVSIPNRELIAPLVAEFLGEE